MSEGGDKPAMMEAAADEMEPMMAMEAA